MNNKKYEKYIHTHVPQKMVDEFRQPQRVIDEKKKGKWLDATWMFHMDKNTVPGAFYTGGVWMWDKKGAGPLQLEIAHTHEFDETMGFLGTVRDDPHSLGGEVEFWMDDEKYVLDKSCIIYIPRGMKHLPLYLNRIDSPIFFWTAGNGADYGRDSGNEILAD